MSGILNVMVARFGGASVVGLLASIRNTNNTGVSYPQIAIRNDQLNMTFRTTTSDSSVTQLTAAGLTLELAFSWQTTLSNGADYPISYDVAIDSGGNIVAVGGLLSSSASEFFPYAVKFNSSGVVQWQHRLEGYVTYNGVAIDASDNIYAVGTSRIVSLSRSDIYAVKYNSSGTVQYQRLIGDTGTSADEFGNAVAIPSTTSFVLATQANMANPDGSFWVLQQSNGTTVSATSERDSGGSGRQEGIAVIAGEGPGVAYYVIRSYATLSTGSRCTQVVLKWVSGTGFTWQRTLTDSSTPYGVVPYNLCLSPANNAIYVVATAPNSAGTKTDIQLSKLDTSGSILWQRGITSPTASLLTPDISVDSLDNIYVSFTSFTSGSAGGTRSMVLKVPGSGAGGGNSVVLEDVTYSYTVTFRSASTGSLLTDTQSRANSSQSISTVTPTATSATGTLAVTSGLI